MSFTALAWASKCHVTKSADKLILLALADRHSEESGCAYPSIAWLCEFSSLNRKTVIAALDRLQVATLISDSGDRRGDTKQIKVYRLHIETVPKKVPSQKRNSSEISRKQSQKRDTDTIREPITSEAKASSVSRTQAHPFPCPAGVDPQHWADFRRARKAKKCTDSLSAYTGIIRDISQFSTAEWPPGRLVQRSAEKGWASIVNPNEHRQDNRNAQHRPANDQPSNPRVRAAIKLAAQRNIADRP